MHAQSESMETVVVHGGERRPGPEGSVVYPIYATRPPGATERGSARLGVSQDAGPQ